MGKAEFLGKLTATASRSLLSPWDVADIEYYFKGFEADIGHKSMHYEMLGGAAGYVDHHDDRMMDAVKRANRVRRRLIAMPSAMVVVLFRHYGYRSRFSPLPELDEWATLAVYTPLAERLAAKASTDVVTAIKQRAKRTDRKEFIELLKSEARALLAQASKSYNDTKDMGET